MISERIFDPDPPSRLQAEELVRSHPALRQGPIPAALQRLQSDDDVDVVFEARLMLQVMLWPHPALEIFPGQKGA
jgi:hypothetical protein